MFGTVSTKNLYLVMMNPIIKMERYGFEKIYSCGDDSVYAFAYKKDDDTYIDFFTHTVYKRFNCMTEKGDYVVRWAKPLIIDRKRVPISVLRESLAELNDISLEEKSKQKIKKP